MSLKDGHGFWVMFTDADTLSNAFRGKMGVGISLEAVSLSYPSIFPVFASALTDPRMGLARTPMPFVIFRVLLWP